MPRLTLLNMCDLPSYHFLVFFYGDSGMIGRHVRWSWNDIGKVCEHGARVLVVGTYVKDRQIECAEVLEVRL